MNSYLSQPTTWWLRRFIECPTEVELWGTDYTVIPRLVEKVFGDGGKLLIIEPTDTRPNFYVVRVPSALIISNSDKGEPHIADILDDICEAIEDEYGMGTCGYCGEYVGSNYDCEECKAEPERPFPALHERTGLMWCEMEWPSCRAASDDGGETCLTTT